LESFAGGGGARGLSRFAARRADADSRPGHWFFDEIAEPLAADFAQIVAGVRPNARAQTLIFPAQRAEKNETKRYRGGLKSFQRWLFEI
jgi:hypothetical protein